MSIEIDTILRCGCCGNDFKTWEEYEDQDQDYEYGICYECQDDIKAMDVKEYDKLIACVKTGLKEDKLEKFLLLARSEQEAFAYSCLDKGLIKLTFGKV